MLLKQQKLLKGGSSARLEVFKPFQDDVEISALDTSSIGRQWVAEGKAGCLVIAGGQGTRLGFEGPKGMYPITPFQKKTLFQLLLEKIFYAGKQVDRPLDVAIMISPEHQDKTERFLEENDYFGLNKEQVALFEQETLPFLNDKGELLYCSPTELVSGPNGNGDALKLFSQTQDYFRWKEKGIEIVNVVLIDNPLTNPYDPLLLGYHAEHLSSDIVMLCTERVKPEEKMGVLVERNGVVSVKEYSEMPKEEMAAKKEGELKFRIGNLSTFSVKMSFIDKTGEIDLPLHLAHKSVEYLNGSGELKRGKMWKFEKFIFDLLPFAKDVKAVLYPRKFCFAPLKNREGDNSPESVRKRLQEYDRGVIEEITGLPPPNRPFELSPEFYYPSDEMLSKWKGKELPDDDYIS